MVAMPIVPRVQRFATAASPGCIARHGRPTHPLELLQQACLRGRFSSGAMNALGVRARRQYGEGRSERAVDRGAGRSDRVGGGCGAGGERDRLSVRRLAAAAHGSWGLGASARALVAEVFGAVFVLRRAQALACAVAGVRGFRADEPARELNQSRRKRLITNGCNAAVAAGGRHPLCCRLLTPCSQTVSVGGRLSKRWTRNLYSQASFTANKSRRCAATVSKSEVCPSRLLHRGSRPNPWPGRQCTNSQRAPSAP